MCQNEVSWKLIVPSFYNRYVCVHHVSVCESTHNAKQHTHNIHSHSQHIDVNIQQYTHTQSTNLFQCVWEWSLTFNRSETAAPNHTIWMNYKHVSQQKYQTHHNVNKLTFRPLSIHSTYVLIMANKYSHWSQSPVSMKLWEFNNLTWKWTKCDKFRLK